MLSNQIIRLLNEVMDRLIILTLRVEELESYLKKEM